MIKAITFDLDGVYFTADSFAQFKQSLGVSSFNDDYLTQFKKGELTEDQFWDLARKELNFNLTNQEIFNLLKNSYQVNQNVVDTVKKVRSLGAKTCICTNNFPTRINALNQKFNFLADFNVVVLSYQIGAVKPDPKIFQTLITRSGCLPSEIFYADDKQTNVDSALSLGINAFVYTGFEDFVNKLKTFGLVNL